MVVYHNKNTKVIQHGQLRVSDCVREYLDNIALLELYCQMYATFKDLGLLRATSDYEQLAIAQYNLCLEQQFELYMIHGVNV